MDSSKESEFNKTLQELRSLSTAGLKKYEQAVLEVFRRKRRFSEAIRENYKILNVYDERVDAEDEITFKDINRIEYEIAYIYSLTETFAPSIRFFQASVTSAEKCRDKLGGAISGFRLTATKYFAGVLGALETIREAQEYKLSFAAIKQTAKDDKVRTQCDNWVYNIDWRIFDIAAEIRDIDLLNKHYESIVAYMDEQLNTGIQHQFKITSCEGLLYFAKGDYTQSLEKLSKIIDFDLTKWGQRDAKLLKYGTETMGLGLAREYLFAGRALQAIGEDEKAKEIFETALNFPRNEANYFYQDKIQSEL